MKWYYGVIIIFVFLCFMYGITLGLVDLIESGILRQLVVDIGRGIVSIIDDIMK